MRDTNIGFKDPKEMKTPLRSALVVSFALTMEYKRSFGFPFQNTTAPVLEEDGYPSLRGLAILEDKADLIPLFDRKYIASKNIALKSRTRRLRHNRWTRRFHGRANAEGTVFPSPSPNLPRVLARLNLLTKKIFNIHHQQRIKEHYDKLSPYYHSLWGMHIHHGFWETGKETKEEAQSKLIDLVAKKARVAQVLISLTWFTEMRCDACLH